MVIEPLADHPDFVETIGRWHWDEWGHADPKGSLETWTIGISKRNLRNSIPTTFVAMSSLGEAMGSVTLVENDMDTRKDLRPWLAGLYVASDQRGAGVGTALIKHAMNFASKIGSDPLYLYTSTAKSLYESLGWVAIDQEHYEGEDVAIMMARVA